MSQPPPPQTPLAELKGSAERVESVAKAVTAFIGAVVAVSAGVLGVIAILSDIYYFFLALATVTVVWLVLFGLLLFFRNRSSTIAPGTKVRRYGKGPILLSLGLLVLFGSSTICLLVHYFDSIFDPVIANANESALTVEAADESRIETVTVYKAEWVRERPQDQPPDYLQLPDRWVILDKAKDKASACAVPFTLTFDVVKKERFSWAKIERVFVKVLSYAGLPRGLRLVPLQLTRSRFVQPLEFKVTIPKQVDSDLDNSYLATLVGTSRPTTSRHNIVIEDSKPVPFYVDVCFENEGIYELMVEVVVSTGWRRTWIRPLKPAKVGCIAQDRPPQWAPAPGPAPAPAPAPKPPPDG